MTRHPTLEQLAAWVVRAQTEVLPRSVKEHLAAECPECERTIRVLAKLEKDASRATAPADVLDRVRALIHDHRALIDVAVLVGDRSTLVGARSAAVQDRFLVFRSALCDIDVRIRRDAMSSRHEVRGQVHLLEVSDAPNLRVQLVRGGKILAQTAADDLGKFVLPRAPQPPFHLSIQGPQVHVDTHEIPRAAPE